MAIRRKFLSCMIVAFAVLLAAVNTPAQDTKAPFTLTLSAKTYEFRAGSTVKIEIVQTNNSKSTVDCSFQGFAGVNYLFHYDVLDEDGKPAEKVVRPHMDTEPNYHHECDLAPGESSSHSIPLNMIYKLDRPGKYTVQVFRFDTDLTDDQGTPLKVLSNPITITITG